MKTVTALAALITFSGAAMAQQPSAVQKMTDFLKANRGAASVASAVSGNGNGGWGNIGSAVVTKEQVSNRQAK